MTDTMPTTEEPRLETYQVILRPLVTEKGMHRSTRLNNQYAFEINPLATKDDVRRAVEDLFNVIQSDLSRPPRGERERLCRADARRQAGEVAAAPAAKKGGRNNQGGSRPASRRRPQAAYRVIDFRRDKDGVPAKVHSIEYDPNRNARIALLHYVDGEKRYIIAPDKLKAARWSRMAPTRRRTVGNCLPLAKRIPLGTGRFTTSRCSRGAARALCRRPGRVRR
jgi:hypothetical protein